MASTIEAFDLPFDEAIQFLRDKASVTTRTWTDVYGAAHSRAFMVAGAATEALVNDFRQEITKALEKGTTLQEFRKGFDAIVDKHGWDHTGSRNWRSRVIFETNLRSAYAAGRYAQLTAPETLAAFPYWQYNHSGALHPRLDHLRWDGLTLPADDPFWKTNYPPNGWGCGCSAMPASARDLRRQGKSKPDASPDLVFRAEEVGGVTRRVPMGVDPGFEWSPGEAWMKRTMPGSQTVGAAPGMIRRFAQAALRNSESAPARSWVPVARAPAGFAEGAQVHAGTEIRLSADTIRSHTHHVQTTPDVYSTLIEEAAERGELIAQGNRLQLIVDYDGEDWLAGLKRTEKGELYLTTLHRTRPKQIERIRAGGTQLRKGKRAGGP